MSNSRPGNLHRLVSFTAGDSLQMMMIQRSAQCGWWSFLHGYIQRMLSWKAPSFSRSVSRVPSSLSPWCVYFTFGLWILQKLTLENRPTACSAEHSPQISKLWDTSPGPCMVHTHFAEEVVNTGSSIKTGLLPWWLLGGAGLRWKPWPCFVISIPQTTTMNSWWTTTEMIQRDAKFDITFNLCNNNSYPMKYSLGVYVC